MREYPFEKSVLLNAVYDVLDKLALPLTWADSRSGIVCFGEDGQITLTTLLQEDRIVTRVEISDSGQVPAEILLDELHAALKQTYETKRRTL